MKVYEVRLSGEDRSSPRFTLLNQRINPFNRVHGHPFHFQIDTLLLDYIQRKMIFKGGRVDE